jgi:hypothetical protein
LTRHRTASSGRSAGGPERDRSGPGRRPARQAPVTDGAAKGMIASPPDRVSAPRAALIDRGVPPPLLRTATASPTFFPGVGPTPSSRGKKPGLGRPPLALRPSRQPLGCGSSGRRPVPRIEAASGGVDPRKGD